ncbi:hypothetical protein JCM11491_001720 [Sporobolomyces phaffii]
MVTSICVIGGAGVIGRRHVQHCIDDPRVELSCIVDPTPAGAAFARERGVPRYETLDQLLDERGRGSVRVDGAILATPNSTHVPLGIQLLEAGIPTLVEKPLSTDVASGRRLVQAETNSSTKTLNPYVRRMKQLLDSGSVGRVLAVQGVWAALKPLSYFGAPTEWRQSSATGGGVILTNLVHDVDLFRYWFGDVARVYCDVARPRTRKFDLDDTGALTLRFASGVVATFVFSDAAAAPYNFESATGENPLIPHVGAPIYTVLGTHGSFSFPDLKLYHYGDRPNSKSNSNSKSDAGGSWTDPLTVDEPPPPPADLGADKAPFTYQLAHFVDVVTGTTTVPECSSRDALETMVTLEAIRESIATGRAVDVVVDAQETSS